MSAKIKTPMKFSQRILKLKKPIPVTLLSGFLGAGKTTLLKRILTTDHGLKIAVIVNDVSQLNIDATFIQNHNIIQKEEKLIQLQNGCICCTLRGELLEELVNIAKDDKYQYIIIESTGISEPMQVAETFTTEFTEALLNSTEGVSVQERETIKSIISLGGLSKLAKLDTCVTMVDAKSFTENLETIEFLVDRYGDNNQGELERTITDLLVDQIEFSDVIIINKILTVDKKTLKTIEKIIKTLNPVAKIVKTDYAKVDVKDVVNTGLYDFEKASTSAGWLHSLNEMVLRDGFGTKDQKTLTPKPETEEYGINNFIYRARKPFHPERIYNLLKDKFIIIEKTQEDSQQHDESDISSLEDESEVDSDDSSDYEAVDATNIEKELLEQELIQNKKNSPFGSVIRSKGFFWLASRYIIRGEWSSAGSMLTMKGGIPWFSVTGIEMFPSEAAELIKKDMIGEHGDRRQELVFIGLNLNEKALTQLLDSCLITDEELVDFNALIEKEKNLYKIEKRLISEFADGFEDWILFDDETSPDDVNIKSEVEPKDLKLGQHHNHTHIKVSV